MGPTVDIVPARADHAEQLAPLMRDADVAEIYASGGVSPLIALLSSLASSEVAYALLFDKEVAAMFGVVPAGGTLLTPTDSGVAWALTGRAVAKHPKAYLRASRSVLPALLKVRPLLFNIVDARYTGALRWAEWLGFDVRDALLLGPYAMPFHPIVRRA